VLPSCLHPIQSTVPVASASRGKTPRRRSKTRQTSSRPETGQSPAALRASRRRFVLEFLANGGNATRAYLATHPEASVRTAGTEGWRLLKNPEIAAAIEKGREASFKRLEMSGDEAVALLSISARADIGDAFDERGKMLPLHLWPERLRLAVRTVKPTRKGLAITLHDGLKARELMAMVQGRLRASVELHHSFDPAGYLAGLDQDPGPAPTEGGADGG
jgi:hypothetical protein